MRGWIILALTLALPARPAWAEAPATSEQLTEGQILAERLFSAQPEEEREIHGTLLIRAGKQTQQIPMTCRVLFKDGAWETGYDTAATSNAPAERLIIRHTTNGPNEYR